MIEVRWATQKMHIHFYVLEQVGGGVEMVPYVSSVPCQTINCSGHNLLASTCNITFIPSRLFPELLIFNGCEFGGGGMQSECTYKHVYVISERMQKKKRQIVCLRTDPVFDFHVYVYM